MDDRVAQLLLAGMAGAQGAPAPSPAAQEKFGRIADALAAGARDVIETPGRAMQNGITTGEAVDWAAPMALSMVGAGGVPPGAIGSSWAGRMGAGGRWNPLDDAEAFKQRALERRNEGGSTVRVFKSERALDASRRPLSDWEQSIAEAKHGWKSARQNAVDGFRSETAVNPLLADPYWDPFAPAPSLADRFINASGARDVPGLANGTR